MDNNLVLISNILSTQEKNIEQSEYKLRCVCIEDLRSLGEKWNGTERLDLVRLHKY